MFPELKILVADDDPEDRMLCKDALSEAGLTAGVEFVTDGEELMTYLRSRAYDAAWPNVQLPTLVLLDLNMPRKDGREALAEIKADPRLKHIPVIVLTTSRAEEDIARSYNNGANSFVTKPFTYDGMFGLMSALANYWVQTTPMSPAFEREAV